MTTKHERAERLVYLHGFASSPQSRKAQAFAEALGLRGVEPEIPDLNEPDFRELTISRQLALLERMTVDARPRSILLVGSSLGGYTAALFAARSDVVAAAVLMAPAFDFAERWAKRLGPEAMARWRNRGAEPVEHYGTGKEELIGYGLMRDAARHAAYPDVQVPTLVFHGTRDETVLPDVSERFARAKNNVSLVLLDDDHALGATLETIVARSLEFLAPWLARR
jgi:pimeloyl-ACP methyl ester carboxylesterase